MEKTIPVVIADDHSILRQGTARMLSFHDQLNLLGQAGDTEELAKLVETTKPTVVVTDIDMPGPPVFEVMAKCVQDQPDVRWMIMSMHESPDYIFRALDAGAKGYITKYSPEEELVKAIETLAKGEEYYSQKVAQIIVKGYRGHTEKAAEQDSLDTLSRRELEVLELLADGMSTRQIAEKLFISERTVSNHRANMLHKTEATNTVELVTRYLQRKNDW